MTHLKPLCFASAVWASSVLFPFFPQFAQAASSVMESSTVHSESASVPTDLSHDTVVNDVYEVMDPAQHGETNILPYHPKYTYSEYEDVVPYYSTYYTTPSYTSSYYHTHYYTGDRSHWNYEHRGWHSWHHDWHHGWHGYHAWSGHHGWRHHDDRRHHDHHHSHHNHHHSHHHSHHGHHGGHHGGHHK
jgi:hypothetical protein